MFWLVTKTFAKSRILEWPEMSGKKTYMCEPMRYFFMTYFTLPVSEQLD